MHSKLDWPPATILILCLTGVVDAQQSTGLPPTSNSPAQIAPAPPLEEITVTAERLNLIGTASTASEGVVVNDELALTPAYRPAQLLETVPGFVATSHSGEGKANQYMLRGYNLDHGTDLAIYVDGMPVNDPTHTHGQGYADLNFMIAEFATNITYTKGTYYADEGDFASVGSVHMSYLNHADDQVSVTGARLVLSAYSQPLRRHSELVRY